MFDLIRNLLIGVACMLFSNWAYAQYCDPELTTQHPNSQYIDHSDGTVTDQRSGLMWQKCPLGTAGNTCTGNIQTFTWKDAQLATVSINNQGLAGYTNWRVPNIKELMSLAERTCQDPSINSTIFPFPEENFHSTYWSSTTHNNSVFEYYDNTVFTLNFYIGESVLMRKIDSYALRLVRTIPE